MQAEKQHTVDKENAPQSLGDSLGQPSHEKETPSMEQNGDPTVNAAPEASGEEPSAARTTEDNLLPDESSKAAENVNKEASSAAENVDTESFPKEPTTMAIDDQSKPPVPATNASPTITSNKKEDTAEESPSQRDGEAKPDDSAISAAATPTPALQRPVKRARTGYFIFADDKRPELQKQHAGEGVAVVAKALGQLWNALPEEERKVYQEKAAEERTRVQAELKALQDAGVLPDTATAASAGTNNTDPTALVFPLGRVRKICKLDPDVRVLQPAAISLITKAAEMFLVKFGQEAVNVASVQNRRKLLPEDLAMVSQNKEAFHFLKDDLQDLVAQQAAQQQYQSATAAGSKRKAEAPSQSNKLTSYFTVKSNVE